MLISTGAAVVIITLAVLFHYEVLRVLSIIIPRLHAHPRFRIAIGVLGTLIAHALEVWIFAIGYFFLNQLEIFGGFEGVTQPSLEDFVYFSFVTYTTLGYGDLAPVGPFRFVAGMESLTGLVLITWSASFLFIEMQKYWNHK